MLLVTPPGQSRFDGCPGGWCRCSIAELHTSVWLVASQRPPAECDDSSGRVVGGSLISADSRLVPRTPPCVETESRHLLSIYVSEWNSNEGGEHGFDLRDCKEIIRVLTNGYGIYVHRLGAGDYMWAVMNLYGTEVREGYASSQEEGKFKAEAAVEALFEESTGSDTGVGVDSSSVRPAAPEWSGNDPR